MSYTLTVLTARLDPGTKVMEQAVTIETSPGLVVETEPVRVPSRNEISWRLRVHEEGIHWADVNIRGNRFRKILAAGRHLVRVSPLRPGGGFLDQLLNPSEPPLPRQGPVVSMEARYPAVGFKLGGHSLHWPAVFFVLTLAFGLVLMKPLRVTV